jgi:hypothetical protein
MVRSQPGQIVPYLEKTYLNTELMEWLKMEALSSNPSTAKKKKKKKVIT